jgi:hypothetical protein
MIILTQINQFKTNLANIKIKINNNFSRSQLINYNKKII